MDWLVGKWLYRALWREAGRLKDPLAISHYRQHVQAIFRADLKPGKEDKTLVKRTLQANKLLRQLQAANDGYQHALNRVLETTYNLRAKGKHVGLAPFRSPSSTPTFSPALTALLTSPISHTGNPPTRTRLTHPPTLPPRTDPSSDQARLLGPLIPQRVKAIKKRWKWSQMTKIKALLAVVSGDGSELGPRRAIEAAAKGEEATRPRKPRRLQSSEERQRRIPGPSPRPRPAKEGEEAKLRIRQERKRGTTKWSAAHHVTPRYLRRRYLDMLEGPVLVQNGEGFDSKWEVRKSELAKGGRGRYAEMSERDLRWETQNSPPPAK